MGFFSAEDYKQTSVEETSYKGCLKCNLYQHCKNPKLKPFGLGKKGVYILLSEPTKSDDTLDLKGSYYKKLQKTLQETVNLNTEVDCVTSHAIKCYTKDTISNEQIDNCRRYVYEDIKKHKPKLIYAVGATAMRVLFGDVWKGGITDSIGVWVGYVIPHRELNAWVCPIFEPQEVSRRVEDEYQPQVEVIWKQTIEKGYTYLDKKIPNEDYNSLVKCLYDEEEVYKQLYTWKEDKPKYLSFDYETTGIKPRNEGHNIVIVSMCDEHYSYSFLLPKQERTLSLLKHVLADKKIGKFSHNMKFEDLWTKVKLDTQVGNWTLDTMISSHVLDSRNGTKSLKFQTFVNFGVGDYSSHIENYLKGRPTKDKFNDGEDWEKYTSNNDINDIYNIPVHDNLMYCGLDSLFTYKLALNHMERLMSDETPRNGKKKLYGYDLLHKGSLVYRRLEDNGFRVDVVQLEKLIEELTKKKENLYIQLIEEPLIKDWRKWQGDKFNMDSGNQLGKYLYEHKGFTCKKFTDKGGYSTDAEALGKLNIPELTTLIEYKKIDKALNTYLKNIWFERNGDKLHAFFNLCTVVSYRSSSNAPNMQNFPKRDDDQKVYARSCLYPHKGHIIVECDYKSLEVIIGCCYHKDPQMIHYLFDETSDMHRDIATILFLTRVKEIGDPRVYQEIGTKIIRNETKSVFTFPITYGSYYVSMAKDGWEAIQHLKLKDGTPLLEHIKTEFGIHTYQQWEQHVKDIEDFYWGELFGVFGAWKKKNYKDYQEKGHIDSKTGFRYRGVMRRNAVSNYATQGSASHCLLYTIIKLQEYLDSNNMDSKIIGQIHDSIILSINPMELYEVLSRVKWIAEKGVVKHFPWIDVPLEMDFDIGELDGSWLTAKEMKWKDIEEKYGRNH